MIENKLYGGIEKVKESMDNAKKMKQQTSHKTKIDLISMQEC
jgi:hypothetical protein